MKRQRTTIFTVGLLVTFAAVPSGVACAGSLLSGYGGPGQGNQAIIGASVLKGPSGGGGGSSSSAASTGAASSSAGSTGSSSESSTPAGGAGSAGSANAGGSSSAHARHGGTSTPRASHGAGARPTARPSIAAVYDAAERGAPAPSTGTLGLSGGELALVVLVLALLAAIGALTWRLTRISDGGGRPHEGAGG